MIYVLNKKEEILDILEPHKERAYYNDLHVQDLKEGSETFEFSSDVDVEPNATIILKTPTGELHPFIVQQVAEYSSDTRYKTYYCDGEFLELRYTRILEPQTLAGQTALTALNFGIQGTRWNIGVVESNAVRDVEIGEYMNVLKYVRMLAELFGLEMRFRVEFSGSKVSARYLDLVQRAGVDMGKEITFGKDMQSIERIENTSAIVTALYGVGPSDDKGNVMTIAPVNGGKVYVEDIDALRRWGKDGEHRYDIFTPNVDAKNLNPTILFDLTKKEFQRRLNSIVTYKVDAVDMYEVLSVEHERVFLGDTVRIKDEGFTPALYVEARVIRIERSYSDPSRNKFTLGDYVDIDITNYNSIRQIKSVLNSSKEKWNTVANKVDIGDYTAAKVVELINDSDATIVIAGDKVDIFGDLTVLSDISDNLGNITAGNITTNAGEYYLEMEGGHITAFSYFSNYVLTNKDGIFLGGMYGTGEQTVDVSITKDGVSKAAYATSAGSASTANSAGYATSAGNSDKVDGYHVSELIRGASSQALTVTLNGQGSLVVTHQDGRQSTFVADHTTI